MEAMPPRPSHLGRRGLAVLAAVALCACKGEGGSPPPPTGLRLPPILQFDGHVYVDAGTSDFKILERVRQQTSSIFPGLRKSRVMVSRRDVLGANVESFKTEAVTVFGPGDAARPAMRVRFRYVTRADVAPDVTERLEIKLAALHRSRDVDAARIVRECTTESPEDRRAASSLNLVFDPTLDGCKAAIQAEQAGIDAAAAALPAGEPGAAIPAEEFDRYYVPITVTLEAAALPGKPGEASTKPGGKFPRYEPLDPAAAVARLEVIEPALDPRIKAAEVIIDPDLVRPEQDGLKGPSAPAAPGGGGEKTASGADGQRLPDVVAPAVAVELVVPKKEVVREDRFDFSFETLLDPKFLAVRLSLLMVYPILRGERKKKT